MNRLVIGLLLCIGGTAWAENLFTANDHRVPIELTSRERNQILFEMREFLHGLHNIHYALARNDMKAVALEAKPMGETMGRIPGAVKDRLPEGFMQMSLAMQEAFSALRKEAENGGDTKAAQLQMAEIMTYCSGCHDTYRFEVVAYKTRRAPTIEKVNPYAPQ